MTIDLFRRLERFREELPPIEPAHWTLGQLDAAYFSILDEIEAKHFHLKTVEERILGGLRIPHEFHQTLHWIEANTKDDLQRFRYGMPKAVADCYLRFGDAAMARGECNDAAEALGRVLQRDPMHPKASAVLRQMQDSPCRGLEEDLQEHYALRHRQSFGHTRLKLPFGIAVDPEQRNVIVSDRRLPHILVFDLWGRFKKVIDIGFPFCSSLTPHSDGTFWTCVKEAQRLVRFDAEGRVLESHHVTPAGKSLGRLAPFRALPLGNGQFAMCAENALGQPLFGMFSSEGFRPFQGYAGRQIHIHLCQGRVIVRDFYTGELFSFDPWLEEATGLALDLPFLTNNYSFAPSRDGWFMDFSGRSLAKFTAQGDRVYIKQLERLCGVNTLVCDIVIREVRGREFLWALDCSRHCVHVFEISCR
ncbi:MAG: hypothetical protein A2051_07715 [Desulfovibrionales bacterium GWA2_65_9]|nr:MAG: hypothetical protein A2051_07715 [Desulfovibrionales bacterium GWA2_65_9]